MISSHGFSFPRKGRNSPSRTNSAMQNNRIPSIPALRYTSTETPLSKYSIESLILWILQISSAMFQLSAEAANTTVQFLGFSVSPYFLKLFRVEVIISDKDVSLTTSFAVFLRRSVFSPKTLPRVTFPALSKRKVRRKYLL